MYIHTHYPCNSLHFDSWHGNTTPQTWGSTDFRCSFAVKHFVFVVPQKLTYDLCLGPMKRWLLSVESPCNKQREMPKQLQSGGPWAVFLNSTWMQSLIFWNDCNYSMWMIFGHVANRPLTNNLMGSLSPSSIQSYHHTATQFYQKINLPQFYIMRVVTRQPWIECQAHKPNKNRFRTQTSSLDGYQSGFRDTSKLAQIVWHHLWLNFNTHHLNS